MYPVFLEPVNFQIKSVLMQNIALLAHGYMFIQIDQKKFTTNIIHITHRGYAERTNYTLSHYIC